MTEPIISPDSAHPAAASSAGAGAPDGTPPPGVAYPKTIKSFVRRAGRTTTGQAKAFEDLGPRFVLPYAAAPLDAAAAFGRSAPLVLEIGFGMGEAQPTSPACAQTTISCAAKCTSPVWARCSSELASKA